MFPTDDEVGDLLDHIDDDGSGMVDYSEFIAAAYDKAKLLTEPNLEKAFRIFD